MTETRSISDLWPRSTCLFVASVPFALCLACAAPPSEHHIGPAGGTVEIGPVQLDIPEGALEEEVSIVVRSGTGDPNLDEYGQGWRFEPEGIAFRAPVTVRVTLDQPPAADQLVFWTEADSGLYAPIEFEVEDSTVVVQTTHFSGLFTTIAGRLVDVVEANVDVAEAVEGRFVAGLRAAICVGTGKCGRDQPCLCPHDSPGPEYDESASCLCFGPALADGAVLDCESRSTAAGLEYTCRDQCPPGACDIGARACAGDDAITCVDDGLGCGVEEVEACADTCVDGSCLSCGAAGEACCPDAVAEPCDTGLVCRSGTCAAPECGNGVLEPGERCDGYGPDHEDYADCGELGFQRGQVQCNRDDCVTLDTSQCENRRASCEVTGGGTISQPSDCAEWTVVFQTCCYDGLTPDDLAPLTWCQIPESEGGLMPDNCELRQTTHWAAWCCN